MNVKRLFAVVLTFSLHFSVCTGGLLSAATVFAGSVGTAASSNDAGMSVADPQLFLCSFMTESTDMSTEQTAAIDSSDSQPPTCDNGEDCLSGSSHALKERGFESPRTDISLPMHAKSLARRSHESHGTVVLENAVGPVYTESRLLASILMKRE